MTTHLRWRFHTTDGTEYYLFPISPNQADSPLADQSLEWFVDSVQGFTGVRGKRQPVGWSFSGVLRSQEHYDALLEWSRKQKKIYITTDLGELITARLTGFFPDRAGPTRHNVPWRHTYRMSAQVFRYENGAGRVVGGPTSVSTSALVAVDGTAHANGINNVGARGTVTLAAPAGTVAGGAVRGVVRTLVVTALAGSVSTGHVTGSPTSFAVAAPAGSVQV